jgi:hypothetical protein
MQQVMVRAYPELYLKLETVVAHPGTPDVLYARTTTLGRPRRGAVLKATAWTRYVLAPGGTHLREVANAGVVAVA